MIRTIYLVFCIILLQGTVLPGQKFESSTLPIVLIETTQPIQNEPKVMARMKVIYNGPGQINRITDGPNHYDGFIGIELRGSTSLLFSPKKPYSVETRNIDGSERNVALLGMPTESDWAFIAPFTDKSLVRDALTYALARRIMPYAPRTRFVELVLNGQYEGIYLIAEKIKRDKNRVNISKLEPENNTGDLLTGGYIVKLDKTEGALADGWVSPYKPFQGSNQSTYYQYHYPKPDNITTNQKNYIRNWITDFEDVMASAQFADSLKGYSQYLDVHSFIDFTLINELAKNIDAYRLSTYLHKDRDSQNPRLTAGPVWDFNIAYGNVNYCQGASPEGWVMDFNQYCGTDQWVIHFWWPRMWEDLRYRRQVRDRWRELRKGPLSDASVQFVLDSLIKVVEPAQARNFERWPYLNQWVWPNAFCCGSYPDHVNYLKDFLRKRILWMDGAMQTLYIGKYKHSKYFKTKVFPNPNYGQLYIQYYAIYGTKVRIRLYDEAGRLATEAVTSPELNEAQEYTLQQRLSPGTYFYEVFFDEERESSGKVLVR
jgi:hypothetical protein